MLAVTMEGEHSAYCKGFEEVEVTGCRCSSTRRTTISFSIFKVGSTRTLHTEKRKLVERGR